MSKITKEFKWYFHLRMFLKQSHKLNYIDKEINNLIIIRSYIYKQMIKYHKKMKP